MLYKDLLVLVRDGTGVQYVTALNKNTGSEIWKTDRPPMDAKSGDQKKAYSTPLVINHKGRDQLVIPTSQWIVSYEPMTGKEIWRARHGKGFSLVPRPVYGHDLVYFATGFGKPQLWAVNPHGAGDVTESHVVWKETKRIPAKPSPLLVEGQVYVIDDGGIVSCFDAKTGELKWSERIEGNVSASPVYADGRIYFCTQEGKTTIVKPGNKFEVLAESEIDGKLMASPVPLDGGLLLRSETDLYYID